jgi:hypothetical protein
MKTKLLVTLVVMIALRATFADQPTTIATKYEKFEKAVVSRVEPDAITIMHASGVARIPFQDLPEEMQRKYGYDPQKALAYQQAIQRAAREQALAEAKAVRDEKEALLRKRMIEVRTMEILSDPYLREQALRAALKARYIEKGH